MKNKILSPIALTLSLASLLFLLPASGCRQMRELKTLTKCQFRLGAIHDATLAGIPIDNIQDFKKLNLLDAAKVTAMLATNQLPVTCVANIEVKNPNPTQAGLNKLNWIAALDDIDVLNGEVSQRVVVPANNGTATIPLNVSMDLKKVLSGKTKDALLNLAFNLGNKNGTQPSALKLKIKPSIQIGKKALSYPGFITLKKEFSDK
ncbi:MAG: hypothetical protein H6581_29615 [Bacteroidia bacterium]|nr:hypothetical protein [Bacteroidia bacterium]